MVRSLWLILSTVTSVPAECEFAVARPVKGNCADLPLEIVRTRLRPIPMLLVLNAVNTSPAKTLRNNAVLSDPEAACPEREAVLE